MSGQELRQRIKSQGWTYVQAADKLALSITGLHKQLRGDTGVSRQTQRLLELQEIVHNASEAVAPKPGRRRPRREL